MDDAVLQAARQVWPPFVLVAGLLAIGAVVEADGLFAAIGTRIERIGGSTFRLLATLLALEAVVTALLNLDTAVVFLTPILLHAPVSAVATSGRSSTALSSSPTRRRSCCPARTSPT